MKRIKYFIFFFAFSITVSTWSQEFLLLGKVSGTSDVENIHVINITSNKFTTTNSIGAFQITARLNDTIQFTAIKYKPKEVIITLKHLPVRELNVTLLEHINVLDEVVIGKILTGDLDSDIQNSDAERVINFYDLGIPGNTNKPKTQNERRLFDADHGKYIAIGLGFSLNVNKILNKISGRTDRLKERVSLERKDKLINGVKDRLSEEFFQNNPLHEDFRMDFLYYCSEGSEFEQRSKNKSDIEVINYLKEKLITYKQNLSETKN